MRTLEVARDDLRDAQIHDEPDPEPGDGDVLLRVESFALTANTMTYGVFGEAMGYWRFFPASAPDRGRIPAWGHAEVLTEGNSDLPAGSRLFGYVPMSTHVVLRPLFVTGFLLADHLAASERVVVSSASSKTALSTAWCLREHGAEVTGLTSPRNVDATVATEIYDDVLAYDDVGELPPGPAAFVDIAGDPAVRGAVHAHLGDDLTASVVVGATHWEETTGFGGGEDLPGPRPAFFFAPAHVKPGSMGRVVAAWPAFAAWSERWLRLEHRRGDDEVLGAFRAVLEGDVSPDVALVASLQR